jgi:hypothetical protein
MLQQQSHHCSTLWHACTLQARGVKGSIAAALGPNIFTDIAFEVGQSLYQLPGQRHVYVASASGAVFDIDYSTRTVAAVHQLHVGAINSLTLHEGFCVTASDDRMLRVWPLDFGDFLMEVGAGRTMAAELAGTETGSGLMAWWPQQALSQAD